MHHSWLELGSANGPAPGSSGGIDVALALWEGQSTLLSTCTHEAHTYK